MPGRLEILTLGGLRILVDGSPVRGLASRKAEALLVYLACQGGSPAREALATLLWDDRSTSASLANLSVLLTSLRKELAPFLRIERDSLSLNPVAAHRCDAVDFLKGTDDVGVDDDLGLEVAKQIEAALDLYSGPFLEGFILRDARGFEEWSAIQRERIRLRAVEGHRALADLYLRRRQYARGLRHAQRLLTIDPLSEAGHGTSMLLFARQGEMANAQAQYRACRDILQIELGVDPSFETTDLYHRLRSAAESRPGNLPAPPTPFVGRDRELVTLAAWLADPGARLLTLVGPGGAGKTRLAIEAASRAGSAFLHGVCFVSFAALEPATPPVPALARALGFAFQPGAEMQAQLATYFRERELLLVLDGLEPASESPRLISGWLAQAPDLRIIASSRAPLHVIGERVLEIGGLPFPRSDAPAETEPEDALRLFEESARRARSEFTLTPDDRRLALDICRRVDGLPLALELAGAWLSTYSVEEVAAELERSLDFLAGAYRDLPERQRSLRAVFENTWDQLAPDEQDHFRRLSIFRGPLTRDAALAVAGAEASDLAGLVDKSLLHRTGSDRYEAHEVLRVYGRERLAQDPRLEQEVLKRFRRFYAELIHRLGEEIGGRDQVGAMEELGREADNLRAAWLSACETADVDAIEGSLVGLSRYYLIRGLFQVGAERFAAAEASLRGLPESTRANRVRGAVLARAGAFESELSHHERANELLQQAEARLRQAGDEAELVFCLNRQGILARKTGRYPESRLRHEQALAIARSLAEPRLTAESCNHLGSAFYFLGIYADAEAGYRQALDLYNALGDTQGAGRCVLNLANIADRTGDFDSARTLYEQSRSMSESVGDRWGEAASLNNLGNVLLAREEYRAARQMYSESLAIKRDLGHQEGVAASLDNLGRAAFGLGELGEARKLRQASLDIRREIGDAWGIANCLVGLGDVALATGRLAEAESDYREALETAAAIDVPMLIEAGLVGWAELLRRKGESEQALEVLATVLEHGGKDKLTQTKAARLRDEIEAGLDPDELRRIGRRGRGTDLRAVAFEVLAGAAPADHHPRP